MYNSINLKVRFLACVDKKLVLITLIEKYKFDSLSLIVAFTLICANHNLNNMF